MKIKFLQGRLLILFFSMFLLGFLAGYDYALVTSIRGDGNQTVQNESYEPAKLGGAGLTDYNDKDIMNKD